MDSTTSLLLTEKTWRQTTLSDGMAPSPPHIRIHLPSPRLVISVVKLLEAKVHPKRFVSLKPVHLFICLSEFQFDFPRLDPNLTFYFLKG